MPGQPLKPGFILTRYAFVQRMVFRHECTRTLFGEVPARKRVRKWTKEKKKEFFALRCSRKTETRPQLTRLKAKSWASEMITESLSTDWNNFLKLRKWNFYLKNVFSYQSPPTIFTLKYGKHFNFLISYLTLLL